MSRAGGCGVQFVRDYVRVRRSLPRMPARVRGSLRWVDGGRVVLRALRPSDEVALVATMDDVFLRTNGWAKEHVDGLRWVVRSAGASRAQPRAVICDGRTGRVVGSIAVVPVRGSRDAVELGWWLGPADRGQGFGTAAVAAALAALHGAGVRRVVIGTSPDNAAARRVAAKVGAVELRTTEHTLPDGTVTDSVWYAHDDA